MTVCVRLQAFKAIKNSIIDTISKSEMQAMYLSISLYIKVAKLLFLPT